MTTGIEKLAEFSGNDLNDLCDATEAAILDGGGFGWVTPPTHDILEGYWRGVLVVPERSLLVARLEDVICGSVQLIRPTRNAEATAFAAQVTTFFIAPWARGHGLAKQLMVTVEELAVADGFSMLTLDVRETQDAAIKLYESLAYKRWGSNPNYARVDGNMITGHYYTKRLGSQ